MLSHDKVWAAIDALASQNGLSPSGLARLAGLDPTTFNPSKRVALDGRPRWPSTESVAKILAVTGEALVSFAARVETGSGNGAEAPLSLTGMPATFRLAVPGTDAVFALQVNGDSFLPLYRNGDTVVASPSAPTGRGDRLLVQPRQGTLGLFELLEDTGTGINVRAIGNKTQSIHIRHSAIEWSARIIWASQ